MGFFVFRNLYLYPTTATNPMSKRKKRSRKKSKPSRKPKPVVQEPIVEEPVPQQKRSLVPYLILLALPFLLYGASISYEYVLDDKIVLSENNYVKQGLSGIKDIFTTESFTGFLGEQKDLVVGARYRPLSLAMFAMEYEFFGLNPKVSHFLNILLYGLTGVLLYKLFLLLLKNRPRRWYLGIPFVAAFLFVLHPIHTEVVANIKSRDEILSLLFALLTLYYSYKYVITKKRVYVLLSPVVFLLALLAKENAITFLAVVPLTLFCFSKASFRRILFALSPLILSAAAFVFIRYEVVGYLLDSGKQVTGLMNNPFLGTTGPEKFATIVYTLGMYLKLLVFPHPLTHDYYPYQVPIMNWGQIGVIVSMVIYVVMAFYALFKLKKRTITIWSILFFIATLSIVSNLFFPIGTFMNERFIYMPSVAFVLLISYWILEWLPKRFKNKPKLANGLMTGLVLALVIGYSYKTFERVPAWENTMTLNRAASKVSVNSARANQFMAYALYVQATETTDRDEKMKLLDEATYFVDRALKIHPRYPDANNCKAGVLSGYYQLDRDLQKLLDGFYLIQMRHPAPFVDTYLNYLDDRADQRVLADFYRRLGTDLVKNGNTTYGNYYLRKVNQ